MPGKLQLYYITERSQIPSESLDVAVARAIAAGVDWVQIREKDLPARRLLAHTEAALEQVTRNGHSRVIVNDRLDVALAAKSHGVHLGTRSMAPDPVRRLSPPGFLIGVSCHSPTEAVAAQAVGADYILLGPIFSTPSKLQYGPPLGLPLLREVTSRISIPVFALGGIDVERAALCRENGAAGVAGIRVFQDAGSLAELVREFGSRVEG